MEAEAEYTTAIIGPPTNRELINGSDESVLVPGLSRYRVRREKALILSGREIPPGNWFAPPGSNRSSSGGNEAAEAFGVEGRIGDSASMQAVTRVNAEQAPKPTMQEPTRPGFGEGRSEWNGTSEQIPSDLPGY